MEDKKCCANCACYVKKADPMDIKNQKGECRLNPPTCCAVAAGGVGRLSVQFVSAFPMVLADWHCHQHKSVFGV